MYGFPFMTREESFEPFESLEQLKRLKRLEQFKLLERSY
jgi:hypothetical protein